MAIYYSTTARAFFDTDIFPTASLPQDAVSVSTNDYTNLMNYQNTGACIFDDGNGHPIVGSIIEDSATEIIHAEKKASANSLGHVIVEGTNSLMSTTAITVKADGTIGIAHYGIVTDLLANRAVTEAKIALAAVTHDKIGADAVETVNIKDGAVTEQKLDSVKDLEADEVSLTLTEGADAFTMSIKAGGVGATELAANAVETAKIYDGAVTRAKMANGSVNADKLDSTCIPSIISSPTLTPGSWTTGTDYIIIATIPANAGRVFDFTVHFHLDIGSASTQEWCTDIVVKTGLTYNNAVENARVRRFWKQDDRMDVRFAFNGLGSGNVYIAVERQTLHPSSDPTDLTVNEIEFAGALL